MVAFEKQMTVQMRVSGHGVINSVRDIKGTQIHLPMLRKSRNTVKPYSFASPALHESGTLNIFVAAKLRDFGLVPIRLISATSRHALYH